MSLTQGREQDYHNHPALSSGTARTLLKKSPLHAKHERDSESKSSRAQDIGSLFHGMVLGTGAEPVLYTEDCYTKTGSLNGPKAQSFRDSLAENQIAVKPDDLTKLKGMVNSAKEALAWLGIEIDPSCAELQAYTEINGCPVRAMYDYIPSDNRLPIIDLKKTQDASEDGRDKAIKAYGYDFQREWYGDVYRAITGDERDFLFLFVEEEAPHGWGFAEVDFMTRDIRQMECKKARRKWKECLDTGVWHGYERKVKQYTMPAWQVTRTLEGLND